MRPCISPHETTTQPIFGTHLRTQEEEERRRKTPRVSECAVINFHFQSPSLLLCRIYVRTRERQKRNSRPCSDKPRSVGRDRACQQIFPLRVQEKDFIPSANPTTRGREFGTLSVSRESISLKQVLTVSYADRIPTPHSIL